LVVIDPDVVVPVYYGQVRTATALPVLTMVCGHSWWASAMLIPTRGAEDLYVVGPLYAWPGGCRRPFPDTSRAALPYAQRAGSGS